jgi:hypothetical protein
MTKNTNDSINNINNTCNFCNQTYTRKQSLIRHLDNNCIIKKDMLKQIKTYNLEAEKYNNMRDKIIAEF